MKTWVKLYTEIIDDPDQGTLSWAERGIWTALLALAGKLDDRDERDHETGRLDTVQRIAWVLRCDVGELQGAIDAFERRGMIEVQDGIIYLPNYAKRQQRPPSSRRNAVADRVRDYRERRADACNEDVTPLRENVTSAQRGVTPSESDTDTDTEADTEEIVGASEPAPGADAPPPSSAPARRPNTVSGKEYFTQFHRKRWATEAQREQFEATERDVGTPIMMEAIRWAAVKGISDVQSICTRAANIKKDGGTRPRASPRNNGNGLADVDEAIRRFAKGEG
jgi:hypothetical protein